MSLDAGKSSNRGGGQGQDIWPRWMWIAVPVLVVVVVVGFILVLQQPTKPTKGKPTPTSIVKRVTAQVSTVAATGVVSGTMATGTPQIIVSATNTPAALPTATLAQATVAATAPAVGFRVNGKAKIVGTGGQGLNMRSGPGSANARVKTLREGAIVELIGGPTDAESLRWWQIRDEAGTIGWVADKWLSPQE